MNKFKLLIIVIILSSSFNSYGQISYGEIKNKIQNYIISKNISKPDTFVYIDSNLQKLFLIKDTIIIKQYDISTAKAGASFSAEFNSYKTPLGLHKIESKIGDNLPAGNIIKMKKIIDSTSAIYKYGDTIPEGIEDIIMTRVLVLYGLEKGINKGKNNYGKIIDTFYRGIYIHGTNNEAEIGNANSHGCIRMRNQDIIELYDLLNLNTIILIL